MPVALIKPIIFLGDALDRLKGFPEGARKQMGVELHKVQQGADPTDWKPMTSVGAGVREIRVRDDGGAFHAMYIAKIEDAIYVPHAFQKKTQKTTKQDLDLAADRLRRICAESLGSDER